MLAKHLRLIVVWVYHLAYVVFFTALMAYAERALTNLDVFQEKVTEYIVCVYTFGADHCNLYDVPIIPFGVLLPARMLQSFYPIMLFMVFGARWSMLHFWKEYLLATWKNKRLYLQFTPSFDPSFSISSSESRMTRDEEDSGLSDRALKKITRAIKDM